MKRGFMERWLLVEVLLFLSLHYQYNVSRTSLENKESHMNVPGDILLIKITRFSEWTLKEMYLESVNLYNLYSGF